MKKKDFSIAFSGLKLGKHKFDYQVTNAFFEEFGYHEFHSADLFVAVQLNKMNTMLELELEAKGSVNLSCDVSDEPFDQPLNGQMKLVVKFGEEYNDEDDEILIIPRGEFQINIAQYVYEMLVLAVPAKRVHPKVLDGTLDSEIMERLEALAPKEQKEDKDENDPRWDALKKLLTDK
ncbi:YceD family protein [Sediminicola luteus]|uniref:DNA-binding protein n=1 Tax=Sediminicola luteus TaxID=319238 RepID=A0A2A4G284_9FLAO|nr:DUF177 domain-containing protein [Sediminicola luteus]PCE63089.1 DNA-binding protein [Sediminicola luteus]